MSIQVRSVKDESELEKVFDLLHQTNPYVPRAYFAQRIKHEPKYKLWQTRVAVNEKEELYGTIQIFDKKMWFAGKEVQVGGLGHLATLPDAEPSTATQLIEDSLDMLREFGFPMSVVTSGMDFKLFQQFGFMVMPMIEYSFEQFEAFDTSGVRPFDRNKDLDRVIAIHQEFNRDRIGPIARTPEDWESQFNYPVVDPNAFWVFERDGELNGYVRGKIRQGVLEILEFGAWKSYAAYFRRIMRVMFEELDFYTARISLRRDEPFFNACYIPARQKQDTRIMWCVLDPEKMMKITGTESPPHLESELRQLRNFQITFWLADAF